MVIDRTLKKRIGLESWVDPNKAKTRAANLPFFFLFQTCGIKFK